MKFLLIDANHLAGRCNAVLHELVTATGKPSGVLHGVLTNLGYIKKKLHVTNGGVIFCWDGGHATARTELYPQYKQGRAFNEDTSPEAEERRKNYYAQLAATMKAIDHLGIAQVRVKGVEADDLIGIFSNLYEQAGHDVIVYSGDHDLHQLVSHKTVIFDPKRGLLPYETMMQLWECDTPGDILLLKALQGDPSDNIDGLQRVGWATALKMLRLIRSGFEATDAKNAKLKAEIHLQFETLERNMKLMRLPRNWEEFPNYSATQKADAIRQLSPATRDMQAFVAMMHEWQLEHVINTIHRL